MKHAQSVVVPLGCIAYFAALSPPLGVALFGFLLAAIPGPGGYVSFRELVGSYSEFGLGGLCGGVCFVAYLVIARRMGARSLSRLSFALMGAGSVAALYAIGYAHKVLVYGHSSKVLLLVASIAGIAGGILGFAIPRVLATAFASRGHVA